MKNSQKVYAVPLLIIIALLVIGGGAFIYDKESQNFNEQNRGEPVTTNLTPNISKVSPAAQRTSATPKDIALPTSNKSKIIWASLPPKKNAGGNTTSVAANCVAGSQCQDTIAVTQKDVPNYYACTLDTQCSYYKGFTGVQTGREMPQTSVPAQTSGSPQAPTQPPGGGLSTANPTLPAAVSGSEGCFSKNALLGSASNVNNLTEVPSTACECGVQPPSHSISGSPAAIDANSGSVSPGTMSDISNPMSEALICMRPQILPDIMTNNFIFPQRVKVNNPFSISFDYKNVGHVGCTEAYFQADITRTIAGQSEYLGGSGAHITYISPLNPGEGNTFTFGSQALLPFNLAGDYQLNLTMFCESPRETHMTNNMKEIHIQAN